MWQCQFRTSYKMDKLHCLDCQNLITQLFGRMLWFKSYWFKSFTLYCFVMCSSNVLTDLWQPAGSEASGAESATWFSPRDVATAIFVRPDSMKVHKSGITPQQPNIPQYGYTQSITADRKRKATNLQCRSE